MIFINSNIYSFLVFGIISCIIAILLLTLTTTFSNKSYDHEKLMPYECGFDEYSSGRSVLDIHYFVIAILFILFDVETTYLLPWCINVIYLDITSFLTMGLFFLLLIIGFFFEWSKGSLDWMNIDSIL